MMKRTIFSLLAALTFFAAEFAHAGDTVVSKLNCRVSKVAADWIFGDALEAGSLVGITVEDKEVSAIVGTLGFYNAQGSKIKSTGSGWNVTPVGKTGRIGSVDVLEIFMGKSGLYALTSDEDDWRLVATLRCGK